MIESALPKHRDGEMMNRYTRAYLETALWASTDDDGEPLDAIYTVDDFDPVAIQQAENEVFDFAYAHLAEPLQEDWPHDLFLTRNGHGAGFWDGDYPDALGESLSQDARAMGESQPYIGDDGRLYLFPHRTRQEPDGAIIDGIER